VAILTDIKRLISEEASAIASLDIERLSKAAREIENLQAKVEDLDRRQKLTGAGRPLTDSERDVLVRSLEEIVRMHDENLQNLIDKRKTVLQELKSVRTKKNARAAYGQTR
jgi:predicted transcriptional regulator